MHCVLSSERQFDFDFLQRPLRPYNERSQPLLRKTLSCMRKTTSFVKAFAKRDLSICRQVLVN